MPAISLSLDEASMRLHERAGNRSALYRWALWELHKGNPKAVQAAEAPTTRRRAALAPKRGNGRRKA